MKQALSTLVGIFALLALACSGPHAGSPTSTSTEDHAGAAIAPAQTPHPPAPPSIPNPAPSPVAAQTQVDVRWLPVQLRPLFEGIEMAEPFAGDYRSETLPRKPRWALYLVDGAGDPQQLYSSSRLLQSVTWPDDLHLRVSFSTKRLVHHPFLDGDVTLYVRGSLDMDRTPPGAHLRERVESAPSTPFTISGPSLAPGDLNASRIFSVAPEPDGHLYLVVKPNFPPPPPLIPGAGILTITSDAYISDAAGNGRHLEGISRFSSVDWLAGGRYLVGLTSAGPGMQSVAFIPTTDGQAVVLDGIIGVAVERTGAKGEDNGYRVAFTQGDVLKLFDARTGMIRDLGKAPIVTYAMLWEQGTDRVLFGNVAFDVVTGAVINRDLQAQGMEEEGQRRRALSPDGRRTVVLDDPSLIDNPSPAATDRKACAGLPSRLTVVDSATSASDVLLECPGGASGYYPRWLDDRHVVLAIAECWACEPFAFRVLLVDVDRREVRSLTDGLENAAFAVPSPDGSRVLVTGARLRLYSSEGVPLHDYGPPPAGFEFTDLRWSPDGSAFAFILGPVHWNGV